MFDVSLIDALMTTPPAEQATVIAVVRTTADGVAREMEGAAMDLMSDISREENPAKTRSHRNLRVDLRDAAGTVVGWTGLTATASFLDEQRVVHRCLHHAKARGVPLAMEYVGPQQVLDSWDMSHGFGVPAEVLDVERWLGEVAKWGWGVERLPDRVRLHHHEPAGGAADVVDDIADGLGELFGEKKKAPAAGTYAVLDASRTGVALTVTRDRRQPESLSIPASDVLTFGATPYGYNQVAQVADVVCFTQSDAVPLVTHLRGGIAHRNSAIALKYCLASLLAA